MENKRENFIFTEGFNCGRLLGPCLRSFFKYHEHDVYVILSDDDIKEAGDIINDSRVKIINVTNHPVFSYYWSMGHQGTALAFASVLKQIANGKNVIHFDSDVLFKENCIDEIINHLENGYDIVGPPRPYKHNLNKNEEVREYQDTVATYCFGINTNKIPDYDFSYFIQMCGGYVNPLNHPVLDFFDGVVFASLANGAKVKYLDFVDYGGTDNMGSKYNGFQSNLHFDCGKKIIHFGGVGSGYAFDKNGRKEQHARNYKEWALTRWCLYAKVVFDEDIPCDAPIVYGRDIGVMDHDGKRWCNGAPDSNMIRIVTIDTAGAL